MLRRLHVQKYSFVAIHCSSNIICALQLKQDGCGYHIHDFCLHMQQQPFVTGECPPHILQDLLTKMKIKNKCAAIAIEDELAITKVIEVKTTLKDSYKQAEICLKAQHLIPYPFSDLYYDFADIKPLSSNSKFTKVLFVAVRREHIDKRIQLIKEVGLKLRFIDVQSFSLLRICRLLNQQKFNLCSEQTIVFIEVNDEKIIMKVLDSFSMIFSHEALLSSEGRINGDHLVNSEDMVDQTKFNFVCEQQDLIKTIVILIRNALVRYRALQIYCKPDLFIFSGDPTILSDELMQSMQAEFMIPCYLANPFMKINFAELVARQQLKLYSNHLVICCGLAMSNLEKRSLKYLG